jgi:mRNA interferase RelE/StbE
MLKINFSKAALKFLKTLPLKQGQQCALKIQELRTNPFLPEVKGLKGYPYFRCRCGEYRIIFEIQEETLNIILVEK